MDKTMADKFMCIPVDVIQNYTFCLFKLVVEMFGHLTLWTNQWKSPRLLIQPIRKRYYTTLGTSVIISPLSPLSLSGKENKI